MTLTVAVVQMDIRTGAFRENYRTVLDGLHEAADRGARLVAFPECVLTGYDFDSAGEVTAVEAADLPVVLRTFHELCDSRSLYCVLGFVERDRDALYNTAALLGPAGLILKYRKIHLPFLGADRFVQPGNLGLPVFELPVGRVGINICYDRVAPVHPAARRGVR